MSFLGLFCVIQCLLLQDVFSYPLQNFPNIGNLGLNQGLNLNLGNNLGISDCIGNINAQPALLSGSVSQTVAPNYTPGWQISAAKAPLVTEIVPNLQFGDISLDGDLPVGGSIKISGTFPVYGYIGVDGAVPSYGTAYVDTGSGLIAADVCKC